MLNSLLYQVEDGFKSGLVTKNDVLKVKLKKSEVLLNKSKLDNGKRLAAMAFCQYIGISYDSALVLNDQLMEITPPNNSFIENSDALLKRTEYALLEYSVEAENLQTRMKLGFIAKSGRIQEAVLPNFNASYPHGLSVSKRCFVLY